MNNYRFSAELEDIHYKYERLESLITIAQMFVAEVAEVRGAPENCLSEALFEIEQEMEKTNNRLMELIRQKGGKDNA